MLNFIQSHSRLYLVRSTFQKIFIHRKLKAQFFILTICKFSEKTRKTRKLLEFWLRFRENTPLCVCNLTLTLVTLQSLEFKRIRLHCHSNPIFTKLKTRNLKNILLSYMRAVHWIIFRRHRSRFFEISSTSATDCEQC